MPRLLELDGWDIAQGAMRKADGVVVPAADREFGA